VLRRRERDRDSFTGKGGRGTLGPAILRQRKSRNSIIGVNPPLQVNRNKNAGRTRKWGGGTTGHHAEGKKRSRVIKTQTPVHKKRASSSRGDKHTWGRAP